MVWVSDTPPSGSEFFGSLSFQYTWWVSFSGVWVFRGLRSAVTKLCRHWPLNCSKLMEFLRLVLLSFNVDVTKYIMLTNLWHSSESLFTKLIAIWGSSDDNSMFRLTRLNLAYLTFFVLHCKTLCEVTKPFLFFFCVRLDDQFWCFDCLRQTQKLLLRKQNGSGSENVDQRSPCSREMVQLEKCLNGAFWMDSKNYWTGIKYLSDRVISPVQ